jgi:hypothetical protein
MNAAQVVIDVEDFQKSRAGVLIGSSDEIHIDLAFTPCHSVNNSTYVLSELLKDKG